jgi:hypothetical protein
MKKIFLSISIISLLVLSCDNGNNGGKTTYPVSITKNTEKTVSYIYNNNGSPIFSIEANTEKTSKIYTLRHNFKSLTNYQFIIDWVINGDTINVTIL